MLLVIPCQRLGRFQVQAQHQHAHLTRPVVAGVLANAIDADQSAPFELGFQLVLAGLVFFGGQVLTERIPGGDEGCAQGVVLGHERFELRARLADVHGERRFVAHDEVVVKALVRCNRRTPLSYRGCPDNDSLNQAANASLLGLTSKLKLYS